MRAAIFGSVFLLLVGLSLACGGGDSDVIELPELNPVDERVEAGFVVLELRPTATVFPTFTAVPPTAVPTPVPSATPYVFSASEQGNLRPPVVRVAVTVAVPDPDDGGGDEVVPGTEVPVIGGAGVEAVSDEGVDGPVVEGSGAAVGATPLPTPYGQLDSDTGVPVRFLHQAVFPLQAGQLPERYLTGDVADLPAPAEFISTTARFVGWVLAYDTLNAGEDWSFDGYLRWVNVTSTGQPFVMYESPVTLETGDFVLFRSLGQSLPGVWKPGWYRVAMLDSQLEEVIGWDFEVR